MGGKANEHNGIIVKQVDTGAGTTAGAGQQGTSTKGNSSTNSGAGTTGTGASGNSGSGATTGATTTKEVVPGLATLSEQEKRDKRNERRRQRYAEKKAEQGETVKPRKVNNKTKKQESQALALNNTQINSLIISLSAVIASRPKCSHWLLTEQEVNSITTPLCAMMKESEVFEKIGEHSNQIALVIACVSVFLPRIIQTVALIQEDKKNEQRVKQAIEERNKIKNHKPSGKNDGGNVTNSTATDTNNNINEYWFGDAIY